MGGKGPETPPALAAQAGCTPVAGSSAEAMSTWQAWQASFCTYSSLACPAGVWGAGGLSGALGGGGM